MAAGDYTKTVWQNGEGVGHPPINETNLNNIEDKIEELDLLLASMLNDFRFDSIKRYFYQRNCKEIHLFDDADDWTGVNANIGEASDPDTGNEDVNFYDTDNVASMIAMHDTIDSIDLTEFNDKESSGTSDIIALSVSILNYTKFTAGLTLKLGDDNANYYSYTWAMTENGRVTFQAKKSAFGTTGAPSGWDDITYVRLETTTDNGAMGVTITGLLLMMYRNDSSNDGHANPFQLYDGSSWSNVFEQSTELWNLYFDYNKNDLGIQLLNDSNDTDEYDGLKIKSDVIDFVWKSIMYCIYDDYSSIMTWYVDSNNYCSTWIDDDDFTLNVVEAGVLTPYTYTLNTSLAWGERLEIKLEKNSDTIRAILIKGNEIIKVLEHETSISVTSNGDLYFGYDDVGLSFIPDFMVSHINNMDLDSWDRPKLVIKKYDTSIDSDSSVNNDPELYAFFPPNSMFEIFLDLKYYTDASLVPDIKVGWNTTGDLVFVTDRSCHGYGTGMTDMFNAEMKSYVRKQTDYAPYGGGSDATYFMHAFENFIIKTGANGGMLRCTWSQNVSDANSTTVKAGSYIKATKCDTLQQNL